MWLLPCWSKLQLTKGLSSVTVYFWHIAKNAKFHQCHQQGEMCLPRHETVYTLHSFYTAHCTKAMTTHIRELTGCQYDSFLLVTMLILGPLIGYQLGLPLNIITCISWHSQPAHHCLHCTHFCIMLTARIAQARPGWLTIGVSGG